MRANVGVMKRSSKVGRPQKPIRVKIYKTSNGKLTAEQKGQIARDERLGYKVMTSESKSFNRLLKKKSKESKTMPAGWL